MRRTVPLAACLTVLAACLTVLAGCGPGGVDAAPGEVAASTSTSAPVADVGDTVAFTDQVGGAASITLDGVRRTDRADSSRLIADVTVTAAAGVVSVDPLRFRAQTAEGS